tara:strand:+ start:1140 stop:1610 length:471 start_codon:yes stop_codon:yes gene_type:complete
MKHYRYNCNYCGASFEDVWGFGYEGHCSSRCQRQYYREQYGIDLDAKDRGEDSRVRKVDYTEQFKAHNKARKKLIEAEKQKAKEKPNETKHKSNQEQSKSSAKPTPAKILASGVIMISTSLLLFWFEEGWIRLIGLFGAIIFSYLLCANFKKPKDQ